MNQSKRIFYFDVLRALAIIGIVFCHASVAFVISGVYNSDFYISAFFDCFRDFSIPVFVMLSGALLINKKDSLKIFFKKRLSRILIPFSFWVVIYIICSSVYITHGFYVSKAVDIFFGTSSTLGVIFWFIWMIIIAYVCIFIINKIISFGSEKYDSFDTLLINLLTVISLIYIIAVDFGFFKPYSTKIIYYLSFMSYIIIGYFLANNNFLKSVSSPGKISIISAVLFVLSYLHYIFSFVVVKSQAHNQFITLGYFNLTVLSMSALFFLTFKYLFKTDFMNNAENKLSGKILTYISSLSFGIYLSHYLIIFYLKNNIFTAIDYTHQPSLIWIPITVVLTLLISVIILEILNSIPYLRKVTGKY